jgi:hypothetical protein
MKKALNSTSAIFASMIIALIFYYNYLVSRGFPENIVGERFNALFNIFFVPGLICFVISLTIGMIILIKIKKYKTERIKK